MICKICNEKLNSRRGLHYHIKREHNISIKQYVIEYLNESTKCPYCGKERGFSTNRYFNKTCGSKECQTKYNRDNNRYSKDNMKKALNKRKETINKKYGVDNVFQLDKVKEKSKKTKKERYGNENYVNIEQMKEHYRKKREKFLKENKHFCVICGEEVNYYNGVFRLTCGSDECISEVIKNNWKNNIDIEKANKTREKTVLEKYGVSNNGQIKEIIEEKCKKRLEENRNDLEYIEYMKNGLHKVKCKRCETIFKDKVQSSVQRPRCPKCNPIKYSNIENTIYNFLEDLDKDIVIERNKRTYLDGLEIDIYLPEYNLGIECHGNYWHSEIFKDKNYHLKKWKLAEKNNIRLLQFFEDEIIYKFEIVKSMILNKIGIIDNKIYARKCILKEISSNEAELFLESNHINGYVNSSIRYGLFYNDELVSCMTLSKNRFKGDGLEITRFATKINNIVVGGFGKLFNEAKKLNQDIYTFADCRFSSSDNVYKDFEFINHTEPNYYYIKGFDRYHRANFMKHKLKDKLDIFYNEFTEYDNMLLNGYIRVYDSGNLKYKYQITK